MVVFVQQVERARQNRPDPARDASPDPVHIAHQPSLTYCFFHSSADIGWSLMAYRARTWTWSTNMPRCLPIETSGPCLSCIFTRKPFAVCETSATARRASGGRCRWLLQAHGCIDGD